MTFSTISPLTKSLAMALVLASSVSTALWAQDATPEPAPAPSSEEAVPAADPSLSMGTEVGTDGVGSSYVEKNFEAWEQRCIRTEDGSNPCQLYQLLRDSEGNAVAEFSLFNLPTGGQAVAGATVVVPLETLLTENLLMGVDASTAKVYPFTFCSTMGCVARIGFTAAEIDQFKRGAKAVLTIVPVVAPDQKVAVELSLKGFTAGYAAVSATNP
ncbi:MAG: invasion associated locus B family protein [Pseudotabrizicola sp.]|uniref:invasion associated locus B family protein n=1 Tax=Pseudotabrizicola sp. TaxID=2939647 RepID=UPI00271C4131|nr:invasion associated locus B family protein [Pseudotabrizicola sp.]MDO8883136.1 invasion associated locus B family protein [Pseudotabrizicola sp.]MDP2083217.1 invasion associated locus B family protein [Pseudotabrizicola sp.]MDZ7572634.1 invasion associated locus B family protein [Pseudotabrizicola sp.]